MHDLVKQGPKLTLKCEIHTCLIAINILLTATDCSLKQNRSFCFLSPESKFHKPYIARKIKNCEWLSMIGFSVSLSDLYLSSDSCA